MRVNEIAFALVAGVARRCVRARVCDARRFDDLGERVVRTRANLHRRAVRDIHYCLSKSRLLYCYARAVVPAVFAAPPLPLDLSVISSVARLRP